MPHCGGDISFLTHYLDIWLGPTGYKNYDKLLACAIKVGGDGVSWIVDPKDGYEVDQTPLLGADGKCSNDIDHGANGPSSK
jgi:hypothetical protein